MQNLKPIMMMAAGCLLPMLFLLVAPRLGISGSWAAGIFIVAMVACHALMPTHSYGRQHHGNKKPGEKANNH